MHYVSEHKAALAAVLRAARLCRTVQASMLEHGALGKSDGSPVTIADYGAQALISDELSRTFPGDPLVAEEDTALLRRGDGRRLREAVTQQVRALAPHLNEDTILKAIDRGSGEGGAQGRFWTLDPIDGTRGFLRNEQYAVALALVEEGEVVMGVLGCPGLAPFGPDREEGAIFAAVKGGGAFVRGFEGPREMKIAVSKVTAPPLASYCESVESDHSSHEDAARTAATLGIQAAPLRMDGQCKYAVVARGEVSYYLRYPTQKSRSEKIWDHAAGAILVQEAGGRVTDAEGRPLDFSRGRTLSGNVGILASNGGVHDAVLKALQQG